MSVIDKPGFYTSKAGKCEVVAIRHGVAIGWVGDWTTSGVWWCATGDSGPGFEDYDITGPYIEPRKPVEAWAIFEEEAGCFVAATISKLEAEQFHKRCTPAMRLIHLREVEDGSSTLPDTLVEKAARAIAVREGLDPDAPIEFLDNADVLSTYPTWEDFYGQARAALEAAAPAT